LADLPGWSAGMRKRCLPFVVSVNHIMDNWVSLGVPTLPGWTIR